MFIWRQAGGESDARATTARRRAFRERRVMSQNIQTIEDLFALLHELKDYPDGVLPTPTILPGTGFFPGALGIWNPQPTENAHRPPVGGIMVVGHNFDSEAGFARSHLRPGENMRGPTWRNLLAFLRSVNIAPEQCFFTNAYVGLVAGNSAVGAFPGARDPAFVRWCQRFLLKQFELMRPQLVLTLGSYAPQFLAHLSPELHTAWLRVSQLKSLDQQGTGLVYPVTIEGMPHPAAAVALTHPAYRPLNVRIRRYGEFEGEAAEQAMVCDAMTKVGL
jgi:uracil-DNA glycosylase